jgi:hypothetical protein
MWVSQFTDWVSFDKLPFNQRYVVSAEKYGQYSCSYIGSLLKGDVNCPNGT